MFLSGMIFILIGLVFVFVFILFERGVNESICFNYFKSMFEEDYNEVRYFDNVSIFFNYFVFDLNMYNEI